MDSNFLEKHLNKVILRIDFVAPFEHAAESMPQILRSKLLEIFPIEEPKNLITKQLQLSQNKKKEESETTIREWHFYGKEREKHLCITANHFSIEYSKINSFSILKDHLSKIMPKILDLDMNIQFQRMGLRYIYEIKKLTDKNPFSWRGVLKNKLYNIFDIFNEDEKDKISRMFQLLEFSYDDLNLRFQYGMYNPDFPARIRQKIFTLDFDASDQGLFVPDSNLNNFQTKIASFHGAIEDLIAKCK